MALTKITKKMAEEALLNMQRDNGIITSSAIETGFVDLDYALGGLRKGETYLLAAGPSRGKTAFALNIAEHLASEKKGKIAFFSLDLGMEEIIKRYVQLLLNTDECGINLVSEQNMDIALEEAMRKLDKSNLYVEESYGLKLNDIMECISVEGPFDLIILDYVQLMAGEKSDENIAWKIGQLSGMAELLETPILILYQLEGDKYHDPEYKPVATDLGSPEIIRKSDNVILLSVNYSAPLDSGGFSASLNIIKNKHGNKGVVLMEWHPLKMRFATLTGPEREVKEAQSDELLFQTITENWEQIVSDVKKEYSLSQMAYDTWLKFINPQGLADGVLLLKYEGDDFGRSIIDKRYSRLVADVIQNTVGEKIKVEVC